MSTTANVTELLTVTLKLISVLEREIEMLRAMKPSEIQALQHDKIVLSAAYEAQIKALKANPDTIKSLSGEQREALNVAIKKFQSTLSENERSLRAAKETTQRALNAIAEEVQLLSQKHAGYSAQGTAAPSAGQRPSAVSFAVDQRL
jgi:hypothetical protein